MLPTPFTKIQLDFETPNAARQVAFARRIEAVRRRDVTTALLVLLPTWSEIKQTDACHCQDCTRVWATRAALSHAALIAN
jgi:hypothetical protein